MSLRETRVLVNPEKALLFRIIHVDNVPWMLDHGLHARSSGIADPAYRGIGDPELIAKRDRRTVPIPPGGTLADYIPFYFTPYSPMLYRIKTGFGGIPAVPMRDIVFLVGAFRQWEQAALPMVFSDRHAYLLTAQFYAQSSDLGRIDWVALQSRDYRRDDADPGRIDRYQAEALVHRHLPLHLLQGVVCYDEMVRAQVQASLDERAQLLRVAVRKHWYYE